MAKSATRPIFVLAIVTPIGPAITREDFERCPDRDALVEELIRRTLGQVYAKMSRDLSASRLVVNEMQRRASDAGIGFSIHATHTTPLRLYTQVAENLVAVQQGAKRGMSALHVVVATSTPCYSRCCDRSAAQSANNSSSWKPTPRAAVCTSTSFDPGSTKTNCPRRPRSENCRSGPGCSHT